MNQRPFGKTGLHCSPLGFGGGEIGLLKAEQAKVGAVLQALASHGVNLLDTASGYEGSEILIGNEISEKREQFILVSKCGRKHPDVDEPNWSPAVISKTVDRSLKRLKTDVLDVMLLHTCELEVLQKGEALGTLVKARQAGKIRFAGFSGDNEVATYAAGLPDVSVVQTSISLADQVNIDGVLAIAKKNGVGVMAKRPIANAAWRDKSQQQGFYGDYAEPYKKRLTKMKITPEQFGIKGENSGGGESSDAWLELALRFTLSIDGISTAIVGTTSLENTLKNIVAAEKGPLDPQAVKTIREAFAKESAGEKWSGLQ